ncbi:BMC domain-containing protein [candidate division KSB1 bacterium]|nr:BMC domain-containing protein [candidate division KSB1 bacterium]
MANEEKPAFETGALGMIEAFSVASIIEAADRVVKAAPKVLEDGI